MKPRELIGTAKVPGGVELRLFRHGDDHMIMVDGNELMSSRVGGSEEALALMACERLRKGVEPHLLIGGYGMGFTLRAALERIRREAEEGVRAGCTHVVLTDEAMGQFGRITSIKDLPNKTTLKQYIKKAMALNDAGAKLSRPAARKGAGANEMAEDPPAVFRARTRCRPTRRARPPRWNWPLRLPGGSSRRGEPRQPGVFQRME